MINSEKGCLSLIDAIYWYSITDIISAWKFWNKHGKKDKPYETDRIQKMRHNKTVNYESAITFLKSSQKGQRILSILNNLTEDQKREIIKNGGLAVYE